ncbi:carbohydrate ABC transporter permease [Sphingobium sp. YR768]|uniref:carbohydrate ABC transporter permease n=1 Tax=Sphingobium sp. YR768 TaxID=1884365 RepID=UPI0008D03BFD|nr:sugar ABC transporter permease [Sphingobium sp. YR768]SES19085.1 carbohydrate ABC transporter membrane protein 1, CUT1 family [Sphingobium sp. YR768]
MRPQWANRGALAFLFGTPAMLGLIGFLVVPFLMAIGLTLTNQKLLSPQDTRIVGLSNYERLLGLTMIRQDSVLGVNGDTGFERVRDVTRRTPRLHGYKPLGQAEFGSTRLVLLARDPIFIQSLLNTILFAVMVVPLQCSLALALALLVNAGLPGQRLFRTVYFSPVVMSMVVVAVIWAFLFNRDLGLINQFLSWATFGKFQPVDWLGNPATAMPAIVIMSAWQGAGLQMLIFLAGLQAIPKELYDAARIDGATAFQRFLHVTLPGLSRTIAFVIIITTIAAFGLFTQVDVMTQGGPANATSTVMFYAIERGVRGQDIAYGSTITVVYFVLIATLALLQQRFFARRAGS